MRHVDSPMVVVNLMSWDLRKIQAWKPFILWFMNQLSILWLHRYGGRRPRWFRIWNSKWKVSWKSWPAAGPPRRPHIETRDRDETSECKSRVTSGVSLKNANNHLPDFGLRLQILKSKSNPFSALWSCFVGPTCWNQRSSSNVQIFGQFEFGVSSPLSPVYLAAVPVYLALVAWLPMKLLIIGMLNKG